MIPLAARRTLGRLDALRRHPLAATPPGRVATGFTQLFALYAVPYVVLRHHRPPVGVFLFGGLVGLLYALGAFGLILVHRANRIINFANAEIGAASSVLAVLLVKSRWHVPWLAAFALAVSSALVSGMLVELLVIRRFHRAPRLILSVVTIFVGLPFAALQFYLPKWVSGRFVDPTPPTTPFSRFHATVGGFVFNANALVIVAVVAGVVVALTAFFRLTDVGLAVRASAENADRAALLGIPVKRVSTVVWMLASALSALGVFLRAPVIGLPIGVLIGPAVLLYSLTAAVIARMEDFTTALIAGVALGVLDQTLYFFSRDPSIATAVMLPVLLVVLLARRRRLSRGQDTGISTWAQGREFRPVPPELRRLPEVQWAQFGVKTVLVAGAVLVPFVLDVFQRNIASVVVVYAIVGVSLVILTGWAGQISLGQWGFAGIGAAVAGGMAAHVHADLFVALLVAGLTGAAAAVLIGLPALRIQGLYLAVTTLGFAIAVQVYALSPNYASWLLPAHDAGVRRPILYGRFDLGDDRAFYWFALAILALALLSARSLRNSRTGRTLIAARDNERGAQSYGVSVARARLTAFAISGFWAALAGAIFVYHQGAIDNQAFDPSVSILMLELVVIGGLTSLPGVLLGALWVEGIRYFLNGQAAQFLASGLGVLVLLLVFPGGLAQIVYGVRDGLLRRLADRRGVLVPSLLADRGAPAPPDGVAVRGPALDDLRAVGS